MENVRIAILSANDVFQASLDNNAPNSMHYYDDELHTYLQGSQYTFECKVYADHDDAEFLVEGNHLSFKYKDHDYYCTIMHVEKDDEVISLEAYGLTLELTNETVGPYKGNSLTFEQYIKAYGFEKTFVIGINEVSNKKISNEWTGTDTILARLFSLANVFDAELEFITELDDHYSLKQIRMNIYQKHDDTHQGIGENKNEVIRDGNGIEKVTKESDISELYTVIRPTGRDGLNLKSLGKKVEYDSLGNEEFVHDAGSTDIRAVQARDRFPSISVGSRNDRWIVSHWDTDISSVNNLYGRALAELKKNCQPKVSYDIKGYIDGNIGDTYIIEDTDFRPALYLKARIVEQRICFTDPTQNKTVFDNFTEMQSEIDQDLLTQMQDMIKDNKQYQMVISSSHGLVLPPSVSKTVLTVFIKDGANDITEQMTINWYRGDRLIFTGNSISVERSQLNPNIIYRCDAVDIKGKVRATSEITISKVEDGNSLTIKSTVLKYRVSDNGNQIPADGWQNTIPEVPPGKYLWVQTTVTYSNDQVSVTYSVSRNGNDGEPGNNGEDALTLKITSSNGVLFKNTSISTTLTAHIYKGSNEITGTDISKLGVIKWYKDKETLAVSTGQTFAINHGDVSNQVTFTAKLIDAAMIKAIDSISLASVTDVQGIYRFYQLADVMPPKPLVYPPGDPWVNKNPPYEIGTVKNLYFVDCTFFSDKTFNYSEVQLSSDFDAIKKTYEDALNQINEAEKRININQVETKNSILHQVSEEYYSKDQSDVKFGEISTSLEQTKNSFDMKFNTIQIDLNNSNKQNTNKFLQIEKYIRFIDGNIVLGEQGNEITLTIENNRISFKQNGMEVAYLSNNKLNVTDADITHSLRIGNFKFEPRPDGSLDFKKASD